MKFSNDSNCCYSHFITVKLHNSTSSLRDSAQTTQETNDYLTEPTQGLKNSHKQ